MWAWMSLSASRWFLFELLSQLLNQLQQRRGDEEKGQVPLRKKRKKKKKAKTQEEDHCHSLCFSRVCRTCRDGNRTKRVECGLTVPEVLE